MKYYISGPITLGDSATPQDIAQFKSRFSVAEFKLELQGHESVNPLKVQACDYGQCGATEGHTWQCWLRYDLVAMLECDGIYLLKRWHESKGALLEFDVAVRCGLAVEFE